MYTAGTISGTKGSTKITGKSTQWLSNLYNILEGQVIIIYTSTSSNAYSIKNIKSNTEIELSRPLYDAVTNATYEIFTTIDNTTSDAAVKIATSIARNNEFMGLMNQWTTGTGTVTVNWGGEQVKLTTVDQMNKNIDGKFDKSGGVIEGDVSSIGSITSKSNSTDDYDLVRLVAKSGDGNNITSRQVGKPQTIHSLPSTSGTLMQIGDFGFGGESYFSKINKLSPSANEIRTFDSSITNAINKNLIGLSLSWASAGAGRSVRVIACEGGSNPYPDWYGLTYTSSGPAPYTQKFYTTANTTKDSNGNLKAASPIVKVFADHIELNDESEGVELKCLHTGIYQLKHVLGLNSDASWGGINGGITIPSGINQLPLIYVDYDVLVAGEQHPFNGEPVPQEEHGDIVIYTSYRKHFDLPQNVQRARLKTYPEFTKLVGDERVELENGAPVDIPAGHWIDVRVNMPSNSIYNQKQAEAEAYAKEEAERAEQEAAIKINAPARVVGAF
ncbi:hypothetical protein [Moellerella wisconsensis]|uniref:Phage tail fiber protein n=1 Tax=Moellerella wisconsensis ATCC 35017 TaxID=1354267 RepID=A0A0N0I9L7_9GAMM|nr:hypothetical protein [Moellerella wisconsensis]KPD01931.1 phage tail fiber protein [Moellerella wisconsensis ATCC 35017]VFS54131.1 Uncharacterised protein [Moellerella wisconsensis]